MRLLPLPKFCKACGKGLVLYGFIDNEVIYDEFTGKSYKRGEIRLVCPDHKSNYYPSGHTKVVLEKKRVDEDE